MATKPKITGFPGMGDYRPPKPGPGYVWNANDRKWYKPKAKTGGPSGAPRTKPQTMEEWATEQAEKRVNAEVEAIRGQQAAYEREMQANSQRMIEQSKNLAAFMQAQGIDKRIADVYGGAARDLGGLASGFAGTTRDVASADAAAQMNMLSGSGQEGAVRNQGENMGDVLYGVGGWIPGKALGEQGAAYAANAALQPAFTMQYGQEGAQEYLRESAGGLSEFATAIAEAQAGKYSYKEELLDQRRKASLDQQKLRLDQLEADRSFWLDRQALLLSQGKHKLAQQAEKRANAIAQRLNYETQGRDYEGNLMPGYTEHNGQIVPPNHRVDKNGNVVRISSSSPSKGKAKYTPTQQSAMVQTIVEQEENIEGMIAKAIKNGEWYVGSGPPAPGARRKLENKLFKEYVHLAGTYKPARNRLRQLIRRLLFEAERAGVTGKTSGSSVIDEILASD